MRPVFGVIAACGLGLILGGCATVREPAYKVVSVNDGYEVREYAGYLAAETTVSGPWKEGLREGFRRLFSYISGNNEGAAKLAMTAPVLSGEPEKVAMTAPVLQKASAGDGQIVSFIAPAEYTMETLPVPKDPRIRIRQVPPFTAAALRYGGWTDPETIDRKTRKLRSLLDRDGRTPVPPFLSAQYNPPWTVPPFRRNEIIVRIQ
ncbi:MAG: heme-binding protein [Deltaproteobacteria bacterium]|nr:heme-binding protein [Deltaproteobacteria bacterium]